MRNVPDAPISVTGADSAAASVAETCSAWPLRSTVAPPARRPARADHSVSSVSVMRSSKADGAADAEPARLPVIATTQAGRAAAAPSVKSVAVTFSNTCPLARSKSAPFPAAVFTGTRSRTRRPPSFTRIESKRNLALYVTPRWSANTHMSMSGYALRLSVIAETSAAFSSENWSSAVMRHR